MAKSNDGAPGIDGVTFAAIEESGVDSFLRQIRDELVSNTYRPMRARKKEIPKDGGKKVRLARNYAYQVLLIDEWRRAGVEIVFLNRSLGQSPEDDLLLQVQGIVSEYERAKIMERSRRGKKHAAQSGSLNVMSNAPFGYRYVSVREGGGQARFEPVAGQARIVQQIFSWIGRDRCSLAEVCRRLQKAGEVTATGKRIWSRQAVWHILQNPAYQGRAVYGKTHMMPRGKKARPRTARRRPAEPR